MLIHRIGCCTMIAGAVLLGTARDATSQTATSPLSGRVSVHVDTASRDGDGLHARDTEVATSATLETHDRADRGVEAGLDIRESRWLAADRPSRVSLYNGFVGGRVGGTTGLRVRAGQMWLPDLGTMGALGGALVEVDRRGPDGTSLRVGAFGGYEPDYYEIGYAPNVRKYGGYASLQRGYLQRHVVGYTVVRQGGMTERAVLTVTNFVPVGRAFFAYQAAEFEVKGPAQGAAPRGLSYFLTNVRVSPARRVELLGTYNRGRSLDARQLTSDLLNGRSLTQQAIEGLRYESASGRITVEPARGVFAYVSYGRDRTNRDDASTGRIMVGGHAGNILRSGVDASISDARVDRASGPYHSQYVSVGRNLGRTVYVSADYSTSLSVLRFVRSDGVMIETRPSSRRIGASGSAMVSANASLLFTVDRTQDDALRELRVLVGLSYRIR